MHPNAEALKLALDFHERGELSAAQALYRALLDDYPAHAQIWGLLGSACRLSGEPGEALDCLEKAVAYAPGRNDLKAEHGIALSEAGRHDEAAMRLEAVLPALAARGEDAAVVYAALGDACLALDRFDDAEAHYGEALAREPGNATAQVNRATALQRLGRREDAIGAYRAALESRPADAAALTNLGVALMEAGDLDEAVAVLTEAAALAPEDAVSRIDLGVALHRLGRLHDAETVFQLALDLAPGNPRAWSNLGNLLQERLLLPEARMAHENALVHGGDNPEFHWNHAMSLLLSGAFEKGFAEFEWRRQRPDFQGHRIAGPAWDGRDPDGKRILLYTEQGSGDAIQFARYAGLLAQMGATVILACPAPLAGLFSTLDGPAEIVTNWHAAEPYDFHAPLMSLPYFLGTRADSIPASTPYLGVPKDAEVPLPAARAGCRVGLVWAGNPDHANDHNRSLALSALRPLFDVDGIEWFGLQVGPRAAEISECGAPIRDLSPALGSFAETAAAMAALDLVISVDTAPAHLAGALGRPVWLLLPHAPDWRWLTDRDDSPWYPTMRLFRQPAPGEWDSAVAAIRSALLEMRNV
jgi:Flp pilus assembly protein TadD